MSENLPELNSAVAPLTDWKNPPSVRDLKQDLLDATPYHDGQVTRIENWLDNLHITGKAQVNTPKGNSRIVPKLIRKQAEWRYAALSEPFLSTSDIFNVTPITHEDKQAAVQNQLVLNNQFNTRINKTQFIDEFVRTAVDEGTVVIKVGWDYQEEEIEASVPDIQFRINPELAPMHQHLAQLLASEPQRFAQEVAPEIQEAHRMTQEQGVPIEATVVGYRTEKQIKVLKNQPTLEICDFRNVIIDPTCMGDIDKAGFVIYSFESSKSALEKDGKYHNLDLINVDANSILGQPDHSTDEGGKSFNFSDQARKKFVVHEYWGSWDIDGTGLVQPIVAAWVGDTLIRLEKNPFPDQKLPFVVASYLPVRKSIYGEPDGALLEDNQKIIGAVTRGMIDIMGKSANGQTGVRKDMLDLTNQRRFEKGQDYQFNANVDPRQGIYMHTYPEIPASAQFMLQLQNMEAESLTGVKSFSQGISGQSLGDVAAGVRGALDAASKRELGILRRLSTAIVAIGRKFISMNAEFLSEEEVVRITNDEFVTVRRDDLAGNFDPELSISTAEEDNNKAQELGFMLQTMGPNMDPMLAQVILADIARLRKMPDLAQRILAYQPQPDPLQQQKLQLEIALLEAQVASEQAKAQKDQAAAQLDMARIPVEGAKAQQLQGDADLKTLDFVEQESGVKQERELQKHGAQAEAQARLKLMERAFEQEDKREETLKEFLKEGAKQ